MYSLHQLASRQHEVLLQFGVPGFFREIISVAQVVENTDQIEACVVTTHCWVKAETTPMYLFGGGQQASYLLRARPRMPLPVFDVFCARANLRTNWNVTPALQVPKTAIA